MPSTMTIKIFECFELGGFVACQAPVVCYNDCKKYKAKLMFPTEAHGITTFTNLPIPVQNERLDAMRTLNLVK